MQIYAKLDHDGSYTDRLRKTGNEVTKSTHV